MKAKKVFYSWMSLFSAALTVIFASIVHYYDFGFKAAVVGTVLILVACFLFFFYRRTKNKFFLVLYGIFNVFIIVGFGLVKGFWNHAFKDFFAYLHDGLPPLFASMFMTPKVGSFIYETLGILIFVSSIFTAFYFYKFIETSVSEEKNEKE